MSEHDVDPEQIIQLLRSEPRASGLHGLRYGKDKFGYESAERLTEAEADAASEHRDEVSAAAAEQLGGLTAEIEQSVEAAREAANIPDPAGQIEAGDHENFINRAILGTAWASGKVASENAAPLSLADQKRRAFEQAFNNGNLNGNTEPPIEEYTSEEPSPEERAEMSNYLADEDEDQAIGYDALGRTVYRDQETNEEYVITE